MARVNALFSSILGTTWHSYRVGLSYLGDDTREQFDGIGYHLPQHIPGAFAEYIFQPNDDFTLQAGLRGDWHSRYGSQVSPRLHLRYRLFDDRSTLRLSAGRGWRVPALLAENTASMASNRAFALTETIRPEASWNLGAGWVQLLPLGSRTLRWTTDYYYTWFTNQLIVDRDQSPNLLVLSNLRGQSYAHSLQTELSIELLEGLTARGAWRWYDVRLPLAGRLQWAPMIAAHRALATVGYEIAAWQFDLTANWVGTQRLPSTASSPEIHRRPGQSPSYWNLHAQVTWRSPKWDVYLGGENLTNFRMSEPIMAANDPFGPHFDAAMVWGPILGRVVYAGMRWRPDW
jgi:outer membrane receptor protein involved in Fe transport